MTFFLLFFTFFIFSFNSFGQLVPVSNEIIDMNNVIGKEIQYKDLDGGAWKQGWEITVEDYEKSHPSVPPNDPLQVYVVPHSHNDPGWIYTFEGYYDSKTRNILDAVTSQLSQKESRHFVWAEISYFSRWWSEINENKKAEVKKLVQNGQLEFVTGGWVMNDEATPHYLAIIMQMTEGHEWLQKNLGVKPSSGWSIDPFGYSPTHSYINQLNGLRAMLIHRAHYEVKKYLAKKQQLEFMWRQGWADGNYTDMFTHLTPFYSYDIPHTCGPVPSVCSQFDFTKSYTQWGDRVDLIDQGNVAHKSKILLGEYKKKSSLYRSNHVLVQLGDDFLYASYEDARKMFENHEKIQQFINTNMGAHVQFSNLSNYFENMFVDSYKYQISYPVLEGDFFTYADIHEDYWSGYFSSRVFSKLLGRVTESTVRAAEIIHTLARYASPLDAQSDKLQFERLENARRMVSLFQHHDGMSGTAKPAVVTDYMNKLHSARWDSKEVIKSMITSILKRKGTRDTIVFDLDEDRKTPESKIERKILQITSDSPKAVIFYNSLSSERTEIIELSVSTSEVKVTDHLGKEIAYQVSPIFTSNNLQENGFTLYFSVTVPGFGISTYFISSGSPSSSSNSVVSIFGAKISARPKIIQKKFGDEPIEISNQFLTVNFEDNGLIRSAVLKEKSETVTLKETYQSYSGRGGAYLFLPSGHASPVDLGSPTVVVIKGQLVEEVITIFSSGPIQRRIAKLYKTKDEATGNFIEVSTSVDISQSNQELVTRYSTSLKTEKVFYTDLNGFQMQKRKTRDDRPIQHNFYPTTSSLFLQDILTKSPMGAGSLREGEIDIMIERRLVQDDQRGLGEGVTDNLPIDHVFNLVIESRKDASTSPVSTDHSELSHTLSHKLLYPLNLITSTSTMNNFLEAFKPTFSPMNPNFPNDIHVVSLKARSDSLKEETTLQLTRLYYDPSLKVSKKQSSKIEIDLQLNFLDSAGISKISEKTLSLLHHKSDIQSSVSVFPRQIRAFVMKLTDSVGDKKPQRTSQSVGNNPPVGNQDLSKLQTYPDAYQKQEEKIGSQLKQIRDLENTIEFTKKQIADANNKIQRLEKDLKLVSDHDSGELNKELKEYRDALDKKEEDVTRLEIRLKEIIDSLDDLKKESQSGVRNVEDKLQEAKHENIKLKNELEQVYGEIQKIQQTTRGSLMPVLLFATVIFLVITYAGLKRKNFIPIFFGLFLVVNVTLPFLLFKEK